MNIPNTEYRIVFPGLYWVYHRKINARLVPEQQQVSHHPILCVRLVSTRCLSLGRIKSDLLEMPSTNPRIFKRRKIQSQCSAQQVVKLMT